MKYVVRFHNVIFALMYLLVRCKHSYAWFNQSQYESLPNNGSLYIIVWYVTHADEVDRLAVVVFFC